MVLFRFVSDLWKLARRTIGLGPVCMAHEEMNIGNDFWEEMDGITNQVGTSTQEDLLRKELGRL